MQAILSAYSLHIFWNLTMKEQMTAFVFIAEDDDVSKASSTFLSAEFWSFWKEFRKPFWLLNQTWHP